MRGNGEPRQKSMEQKLQKIDPQKLKAYIQDYLYAYPREIAKVFDCGEAAIRKALKKQKITRKKTPEHMERKEEEKQAFVGC